MADGYARASGGVGVALATSGPGATNLVTGIATAMLDSSPVVFITGQVNSKLIGYDAFQEIDMTGITLPITKHNYLVTDIHELGHVMREAFYIARTGRPGSGPGGYCQGCADGLRRVELRPEPDPPGRLPARFKTIPKSIQQAVEMINAAKRPVILAGQGVLLSGAMKELREFAEKTRTPVALTLLGLGAITGQPPAVAWG